MSIFDLPTMLDNLTVSDILKLKQMREEVGIIIKIGSSNICSEEELHYFLPSYPGLKGSEFIFTISWANCKHYLNKDVENFVRGLHLIELKYRSMCNHDFGFGSPSPTYKVISGLAKRDNELANFLTEWIAENGGNYYIKGKQSGTNTPFLKSPFD